MREINDLDLVRKVLRTHYPSADGLLRDELWSAGCWGLAQASAQWDETRGVEFETFAWYRIRGAARDALRKWDYLSRGDRARVIAGEIPDPGADRTLELAATMADPRNHFDRLAQHDALEWALARLSDRQEMVVRCLFLHDWSGRDVAWLLGITPGHVTHIKAAALERLRLLMGDE